MDLCVFSQHYKIQTPHEEGGEFICSFAAELLLPKSSLPVQGLLLQLFYGSGGWVTEPHQHPCERDETAGWEINSLPRHTSCLVCYYKHK